MTGEIFVLIIVSMLDHSLHCQCGTSVNLSRSLVVFIQCNVYVFKVAKTSGDRPFSNIASPKDQKSINDCHPRLKLFTPTRAFTWNSIYYFYGLLWNMIFVLSNGAMVVLATAPATAPDVNEVNISRYGNLVESMASSFLGVCWQLLELGWSPILGVFKGKSR